MGTAQLAHAADVSIVCRDGWRRGLFSNYFEQSSYESYVACNVMQAWSVYIDHHLIVEDADEKLFSNIINNKLHVLHHKLPVTKDTKYHLRARSHNLELTFKHSSISESDFICFLKTFVNNIAGHSHRYAFIHRIFIILYMSTYACLVCHVLSF